MHSFAVMASAPSIRFERLSLEDGLPQATVTRVLADSTGFIWVGTYDGLARYDGYNFKIFQYNADNPTSLSSNAILAITEGSQGYIWVGTLNGLNRFDPKTETFKRYLFDEKNLNSLNDDIIYTITEDNQGILWIGTRNGGLNRFDPQLETFTHFKFDASNPNSLSSNGVFAIHQDSQGILWLGTRAGLDKFNPRSKAFKHYQLNSNDPENLSKYSVRAITEDFAGNLWVGTLGGGLNSFNPKTETFTAYRHKDNEPNSLSSDNINAIEVDNQGEIWIGFESSGLDRFDKTTETFAHYRYQVDNPNSLSGDTIETISKDNQGNLWVGTHGGGLNYFNPKTQVFNHYRSDINNSNSLRANLVYAIAEDRQGNLWLGVNSGGLTRFDPKTKSFSHYLFNTNDANNFQNDIDNAFAITEDSKGQLWLRTLDRGLMRFNPETNKFTQYKYKTSNANSSIHKRTSAITEDGQGNFWIGTLGEGLHHFNPKTNINVQYHPQKSNNNSILDDIVYVLTKDSQGNLWVGSALGLNHFNPKTKQFTHYRHEDHNPNSFSGGVINAIKEDSQGDIWIGTDLGLNHFNSKTKQFTYYNKKHGLPNDYIYAIEEDNHGFLWMSSNHGLSRFNPKTKTFKNYDVTDGLQNNEFNTGASFKSKNGELFFGGINGFNRFFPEQIKDDLQVPVVVITEMLLLNQPVAIAQSNTKAKTKSSNIINSDKKTDFTLTQAIHLTKEITLSHLDNIVAFEFSALHFANAKKNRYAYKLEGFDNDWITTDYKNRRATYTNLADGDYLLRVKASNASGVWNEEGVSLKITVLPALWHTWWAYTLYFILSLILVALLVREQRKKAQFERGLIKQLEHKVAEQTASIKEESKKVIKANKVKAQFLTNMSHEIRTPLTSIIGQTEAILHGDIDNSPDEIKVIHNNSLHLLSLVNDTLDLSKIEVNKFELEIMPLDLTQILLDLKNIFTEQAASKGLNFTIHHTLPAPFMINIDGLRLKQILINLCSNAIKFTEKGDVSIELSTQYYRHINELIFTVKDTGIGMNEEQLSRVFDAFTQADTSISRRFGGSGLGLSLSEKLAHFMGGIIDVESKPNQGSIFTLILPFTPTSSTTITKEFKPIEHTYSGTILLAEDHDDNRHLVTRLLTRLGFDVFTAVNGYEVIESYLRNKPDLILLDIQMPEMDGIEAVKILRDKGCEVPIIALTANARAKELEQYLAIGFDDFQTKPFERQSFIEKIAEYFTQPIKASNEDKEPIIDIDMSDLITQFKISLITEHKNLISFAQEHNLDALAEQAHKLAGAAQMFGYANISKIAIKLELSIKNNNDCEIKSNTQLLIMELSTIIEKIEQ